MKLLVGRPSLNPAFKRFQCLPLLPAGADRAVVRLVRGMPQRQGGRLADHVVSQDIEVAAILVQGLKVEALPGLDPRQL
jgi:hypothetical protein